MRIESEFILVILDQGYWKEALIPSTPPPQTAETERGSLPTTHKRVLRYSQRSHAPGRGNMTGIDFFRHVLLLLSDKGGRNAVILA